MNKTIASDENNGFNLNQIGDSLVMLNVYGDWARFSVSSLGTATTWGSTVVILEGSLDPAGRNEDGWFEINPSERLDTTFGISGPVLITGIPSLRLRVDTAQGSSSTFAKGRISVANSRN